MATDASPGMEVSPAQRQPASQQGGRGWSITRMEEPGGRWRLEVLNNPFKFIYKGILFQSLCELWIGGETHNTMYQFSAELKREKIALHESESFYFVVSFQSLVSCGLAGLPYVPVFSQVEGDEMNKMKVKVL